MPYHLPDGIALERLTFATAVILPEISITG